MSRHSARHVLVDLVEGARRRPAPPLDETTGGIRHRVNPLAFWSFVLELLLYSVLGVRVRGGLGVRVKGRLGVRVNPDPLMRLVASPRRPRA